MTAKRLTWFCLEQFKREPSKSKISQCDQHIKVWVSRKWKKKYSKKLPHSKKVLKKGDALFKVLEKVLIKLTKKEIV